jgi:hypothetical protein
MSGTWVSYRAISARTVGLAMVGATRLGRRGMQRYTYEGIRLLARAGQRAVAPSKSAAGSR